MKPYNAVKSILEIIENNLDNKFCINCLAYETGISAIHLQRVFSAAFHTPLAKYIRLRKLSASLNTLAFSDCRVIDIANQLGFEHEQSYIAAFKAEFNITPKQYRLKCPIIKTTPPFTMDDFFSTSDGMLSVPDIVIIPEICLVGELNHITVAESIEKAPRAAKAFWENGRHTIKNAVNKNVYIGLTRMNEARDASTYLSALQTSDIKRVPKGLSADRLPPSEYIRFFYIGQHHPYNLDRNVMCEMYSAIENYIKGNTKYNIDRSIFFERIDELETGEGYCYLEWLTPISLKL